MARYHGHLTLKLVGVERFELPTSCSQSKRATRLRYTPNFNLADASASVSRGRHNTRVILGSQSKNLAKLQLFA